MSKALKLHVGQRWAFFTAAGERSEYVVEHLPTGGNSIAGAFVHLRNVETDGIAKVTRRWLSAPNTAGGPRWECLEEAEAA